MLAFVGVRSCTASTPAAAATVNEQRITKSALDAEIRIILGNQRYIAFVEAQSNGSVTVRGQAPGTADISFARQLLSQLIVFEVVRQDLDARKIEVTETDRSVARATAAAQSGGIDVFEAFPKSYQDTLVERFAESGAELRSVQANITDADVAAYYQAHPDEFPLRCVSHIQLPTAEQAASVRKQLVDNKADFAAVAKFASTDRGSADNGGSLGCVGPGVFPAAFEAAVNSLQIGVLSDPVQTPEGFHIIRVDERRTAPLDDALKEKIRSTLTQQADVRTRVLQAAQADRITVDPRFGTWRATDTSFGILP